MFINASGRVGPRQNLKNDMVVRDSSRAVGVDPISPSA
jgi:hypothetical protein